ncbi:ParB/RepB/Spo0J family partition protein [Aminobacter niigataensis]|uniref:ParB/RepB/Spo0J family partition protein n=1 Tax=Aminobacter niigataensis TaxID=83265 RepID=UPI0024C5AFFA|nr:ParB/RepB/Spo0J family partition protein [Aminobacter niigataensis]CAI2934370.1 DNA-binding protein [Aminobacter niigataensis]
MANTAQKIILSSSRDIPFNKLVLAQTNVRRIKAGVSIDDLAASIARRGLIQSIHARPVLDADGYETGMFEVPAGGRRYRALEMLVKQKRLAKTVPVPCILGSATGDILAEEVSLAENIERAPLHALDQFRAFHNMRLKGMGEDEIASAFFISVSVVKQRLKLASVSPALLDIYAEDGMTLAQLEAFCVNDNHARQEQVWEAVRGNWSKEPYQIRRMLTENTVRASDKRAVFVGLDAYAAAGGIVLRDLFQSDDGGWLQDVPLLERLVAEKLRGLVDEITNEGWKWIEVAVSFPYGSTNGLRQLEGTLVELTQEEQATLDTLHTELDKVQSEHEYADELPDDVDQRLGEVEAAIAAFKYPPVRFDQSEIARAGVFVSVDSDGSLLIERGYVKPEDDAPFAEDDEGVEAEMDGNNPGDPGSAVSRAAIGGNLVEAEDDEDGVIKPLPERLIAELTAHRTLALQDALANNPHVAMTALLHRLVMERYHPSAAAGCLEVTVRQHHYAIQGMDLKNTRSAKAIAERYDAWKADLPKDENAIWDWIVALDEPSRMALLAHCISYGVNAVCERVDRYGGPGLSQHGLDYRLAQADRLAHATGFDMVADAGWRPTVDNYLGRVTKTRILAAVREGAGDHAATLIDHLKKSEMAREAEGLLAASGWLPEPLRLPVAESDVAQKAENGCEMELGEDREIPETEAENLRHTLAAE